MHINENRITKKKRKIYKPLTVVIEQKLDVEFRFDDPFELFSNGLIYMYVACVNDVFIVKDLNYYENLFRRMQSRCITAQINRRVK